MAVNASIHPALQSLAVLKGIALLRVPSAVDHRGDLTAGDVVYRQQPPPPLAMPNNG